VASKGSVVGVGGGWVGTAVSAAAGGGVVVLKTAVGCSMPGSPAHPAAKNIRVKAPRRPKNVNKVWNFIKFGGV
jgi:formyltetrahydrofolate synthetase